MEYTTRIPSPSSPAELERIVEEIYQAKPWGGAMYIIVSLLQDWPMTFVMLTYVGSSTFIAVEDNAFFIFIVIAVIFDLIIQRENILDKKLLVKEIVQQHFETRWFAMPFILKVVSGLIIVAMLFIYHIEKNAYDFQGYGYFLVSFNHLHDFIIMFFLFFYFLILLLKGDLKSEYMYMALFRQQSNTDYPKIDLQRISTGGYYNPKGTQTIYLQQIVALLLLFIGPFYIIIPSSFVLNLLYLVVISYIFFSFRTYKSQRIGQYSARYYLKNYTLPQP